MSKRERETAKEAIVSVGDMLSHAALHLAKARGTIHVQAVAGELAGLIKLLAELHDGEGWSVGGRSMNQVYEREILMLEEMASS
jgi:hypothetical protein